MFDVDRGGAAICNRSSVCRTTGAVSATVKAAISLATITTITAGGGIVCKRGGIDNQAAARHAEVSLNEDSDDAPRTGISGCMTAKAERTESIARINSIS